MASTDSYRNRQGGGRVGIQHSEQSLLVFFCFCVCVCVFFVFCFCCCCLLLLLLLLLLLPLRLRLDLSSSVRFSEEKNKELVSKERGCPASKISYQGGPR